MVTPQCPRGWHPRPDGKVTGNRPGATRVCRLLSQVEEDLILGTRVLNYGTTGGTQFGQSQASDVIASPAFLCVHRVATRQA